MPEILYGRTLEVRKGKDRVFRELNCEPQPRLLHDKSRPITSIALPISLNIAGTT